MNGETELYLQLHKLSAVKSEEDLEKILTLLWESRKTGLSAADKSSIQSLLRLPSLSDVYSVLPCLRSLLRKWILENYTKNNILKLFPSDLPPELQDMLIMLLEKCKSQWKTESSGDLAIAPHQGMPANPFGSTQIAAETSLSHISSVPFQPEDYLPRLKSITWSLENHSMVAAKRVAIVILKLQDCTKSPLGETEVKFRLTRDKLEAMLNSLAYISDRLSRSVKPSEPLQKKQRQE